MNRLEAIVKKNEEIVSYLFFGVLTSIVSWASYSLLVIIFKQYISVVTIGTLKFPINVLIANALSWFLATIFAYITNKIYVFKSKTWKIKDIVNEICFFFSTRLFMGIVEIIAVPVLVSIGLNQSIFGIDGMLAKLLVSIVGVIVNYVVSKFIVFMK